MTQTSDFTFRGDLRKLQNKPYQPVRSDIHKYNPEIREIHLKYTTNTVWYRGVEKVPSTITLNSDLQIHFPMLKFQSTDWAKSSQVVGNTEIHFGNTRNTPKYSLRCTSDQFSIVRNFWTGGRIRPLEKAKSISIEFPKWWEHYPIDQGNARGEGGWLKMMIGGFMHQFQGASALPGSAGEPITLTLPRLDWQLLASWMGVSFLICHMFGELKSRRKKISLEKRPISPPLPPSI